MVSQFIVSPNAMQFQPAFGYTDDSSLLKDGKNGMQTEVSSFLGVAAEGLCRIQ